MPVSSRFLGQQQVEFDMALAAVQDQLRLERRGRQWLTRGRWRPLGRGGAGIAQDAQMISTLESAARAAHDLRAFPGLAPWARDCATFLRTRWPDTDQSFPDAYTTRPR